jgi:hypothetical protein
MIAYTLLNSPSTESIVRKLRALQNSGFITPEHCVRAERYVERNSDIFRNATRMTVAQAAGVAVAYTWFAV